jgi:hypothetical protein
LNTPNNSKNYLNGKLIEDPIEYLFGANYAETLDEDTKAYMEYLVKEFDSWDEEAKNSNTGSEQ